MWHWADGCWWGFGGGWMAIGWAVIWVVIIGLVVWGVISLLKRGTGPPPERRHPLDIARERYARGEISKEEFEQIKKDLS
ncbi:MAG: SHOCT domain-containing protein [Chloroflexi bacterium]|nr:MAG: SHOCT domain-containing protein [Chloroflexota bacterium]